MINFGYNIYIYIYMLVQPRRNVCFVITCLAKDNTLSIATNS
jgi:hypothetical protein